MNSIEIEEVTVSIITDTMGTDLVEANQTSIDHVN